MPKGPRGEKRPADVIGAAILVGRIATGDSEDKKSSSKRASGGKKGGSKRAINLTPKERTEAARLAARARWRRK